MCVLSRALHLEQLRVSQQYFIRGLHLKDLIRASLRVFCVSAPPSPPSLMTYLFTL